LSDGLLTPDLIMEIAEATEDYQVTPSEFSQIMSTMTSIVAGFAITGMVGMLVRTIAKEFAEETPFEVKEVAGVPLPVPEYQTSTNWKPPLTDWSTWEWSGYGTRELYGYRIDDDFLYQLWERPHTEGDTLEISGEVRVYDRSEWESTPKERWKLMISQGFVYYRIYPDKRTARIIDMMVVPKLRQRGIGRKLLEIVEGRVKVHGVKEIRGSAIREARGFWSKLGYVFENSEMVKVL